MSHYKPYLEYKGTDLAWLKSVPSHWKIAQFKRLISINNGSDHKQIEADDGYPVYGSGGVFAYAKDYIHDGESVLLGRKGTIDKPLYVKGKFWTVDTMYWSKILPTANGKFCYYIATTIPFGLYSTNTALPSMTQTDLGSHVVAFPDYNEQTEITRVLDCETTRIDALIRKKSRFLELIKEKILALVMNEQINGNGKFDRLKRMTNVVSRPATIVDSDEYVALGLYNRGRGLFHKPVTLGKDMGDSSFFYVEEGDLILSGQFAWEGAVTMATGKETGCVVSHRYPVIRGKSIATEYLFALFMTNFGDFLLNESSRGAAGRNRPLNINLLLNEKIRIPSPEVQREVKRLMYLKAQADVKVKKSIALLKERRSAFITAAVTGKIDLRGEPA